MRIDISDRVPQILIQIDRRVIFIITDQHFGNVPVIINIIGKIDKLIQQAIDVADYPHCSFEASYMYDYPLIRKPCVARTRQKRVNFFDINHYFRESRDYHGSRSCYGRKQKTAMGKP
ncbi:hypothetical protein [Lachnoclostridium sp. Marseille-P6806]|uniref:hypothetical protein n=1 Tax=Lachnoclostridium sp. Marseille-P6806 TaxID=2364793 RepID=UPI0010324410|nr:hypothetical protein [Lachnoclostridium sp. Marseille-P6806]